LELLVGLADDRKLFFEMRGKCGIIVRRHAFADYPERGFSQREIVDLVRSGTGRFTINNSPEAIEGSYLFFPKDDLDRECKLVIKIETVQIENEDSKEGNQVIVCSAYRETEL
jgi:hypothetical protein